MKKEISLFESSYLSQILDCQSGNHFSIHINKDEHVYMLVNNIHANCELNIDIDEGGFLNLSILANQNLSNTKITANVRKGAQISTYFADFSSDIEKVTVTINLLEESATAFWHLSSLTANNDQKEFDVNIIHLAPLTTALSDNYGVCKDHSKLIFSGCSSIQRGSINSATRQNGKIMVFDTDCDAVAKPILKIDEKEIEASHGAVVGKINEDHLFYLTSRGLNENEAKRLITFGYLKPITKGFAEANIQEEIVSLIEGRM